MSAILPGHHIISAPTAGASTFKHYDETGTFIEDFTIHDGGLAVQILDLVQAGSHFYALQSDSAPSPTETWIEEYDNNGDWVQTVLPGPYPINASNATQNPDGSTQSALALVRFDVNSRGHIYATIAQDSGGHVRVWHWNHNGTFVDTFHNTDTGNDDRSHGTFIKPTGDDELVIVNNQYNPLPTTQRIYRWNVDTQASIGMVIPAAHETNAKSAEIDPDGVFRTLTGLVGGPYRLVVYDDSWTLTDNVLLSIPAGFTTLEAVRSTDDPDYVWIMTDPNGVPQASIYQLRVSTNTVTISPIAIASGGQDFDAWLCWHERPEILTIHPGVARYTTSGVQVWFTRTAP